MNDALPVKRLLEEVFVTEGVPTYTFVQPPNFNEIYLDVRRAGKPVIIEGQSGTGKTTCIKKILEKITGTSSANYLTARDSKDILIIEKLAQSPKAGIFVIDDLHRLPKLLQEKLANLAKLAAEQANPDASLPKLILIGINEVGSDLIQLVPDIAKRTGIHKVIAGTDEDIHKLIQAGCKELNIDIDQQTKIFSESNGDYWLTQHLCQAVCTMNDILETQESKKLINLEVHKLRKTVVDRLSSAYSPAVKEFCRGQRFRPSNDPYYKLLRTIGSQQSSIVDLNELANANPEVRGSINNIKEKRLADLLRDKPICTRYFYYNTDTKNFAIEDPALFYFLKNLDWDELRLHCGFRDGIKDFEYDFAISFAGKNRELARCIAKQLQTLDASVFFDENYEANFLGKTWSNEFKRIFSEDSRLVVCLLDQNHEKKIWPTFERDCFTGRVKNNEVIPIFLDETKFVGIPDDSVSIRYQWDPSREGWENEVTDKITFKIIERLDRA